MLGDVLPEYETEAEVVASYKRSNVQHGFPTNVNQMQNFQHGGQVFTGIDVTGGIEALVNQAVESSLDKLDRAFDAKLENKIEAIAQRILTANSNNVAKTTGSSSGPSPNAVLGTAGQTARQPSWHTDSESTVSNAEEVRPGVEDDAVSLLSNSSTASKLFAKMFQSPGSNSLPRSDMGDVTPTRANNHVNDDAASNKENQPALDDVLTAKEATVDDEQVYWDQVVAQYTQDTGFGPEAPSHLACAAKRCWTVGLEEDKLETIKKKGKIPANCKFLAVKPCNKPIFSTTPPNIRTQDCALQRVQGAHAAMSSLLLQATAELRNCMKDSSNVGKVADKLKDCIMLAGDTNQLINTARRESFKPFIPQSIKKICDDPSEEAEHLFGDNIQQRLTEIKEENQLRSEFIVKKTPPAPSKGKIKSVKGDHRYSPYERQEEESSSSSSNYKASQKSRGSNQSGYQSRGRNDKDKNNSNQDSNHNNQHQNQNNRHNNNNKNKNQQTKKSSQKKGR